MTRLANLRYLKLIFGSLSFILLSYNVYVAFNYKNKAEGDAASFIELAVSLAKIQKYGHLNISGDELMAAFKNDEIADGNIHSVGHSTWRPPVWPLLIAGVFLVFGFNLTYIIIFKFAIHLLGIFLFYKILKLFKLQEVFIVIGVFSYAIHPAFQLYSRVFLSEPITMFFITLWILLLGRFMQQKSGFIPNAVIGGVLILSHPYYVFLPFSIWFVLLINRYITFKTFLISSFICASVVSTWVIRNFIVLETNKIVLTTSSGAVMAKGWNANVVEEHTNTQGDLANEALVLERYEYDTTKVYDEVQRMQLYKEGALHFIKSNPDEILPIIMIKLFSAFNPFPETSKPGLLETGRWIFQFLALISLIYILFLSPNKFIQSLAIGLILSTVAITIITYSGFRFRMPQVAIELLFIIFVIHDMVNRNRTNIDA